MHKISVLGAGIMGHGIAQSFIMGGYPVMLYDIQDSVLETAKAHIEKNLRLFAEFDLIKEEEIGPSLHRLTTTADLKRCVEQGDFTLEAALTGKINKSIRSALSPRHVPDTIFAISEVPHTLNGKKLEVPVKKILAGVPPEKAVNRDSMANPETISYFVDLAREFGNSKSEIR